MKRKVLKIKPFIDVVLEGLRKGMVINMKNIITALCNSELNDKLKMINEFNILTNDIQYQDGIFEILENKKEIDYLILSEFLPGKYEIKKLIEKIKEKNN